MTGRDNGGMEQRRASGQAALGAVLGLVAVAEMGARVSAGSTVRAHLASVAVTHTGVTVTSALVMAALCLLATVPAGVLRPVLAAVTTGVAATLLLTLFGLVTIAGAAALVLAGYRVARSGRWAVAVTLAVPFLVVALAGLGADTSGLAGALGETRALAVLLTVGMPVAALIATARRAHEESRTVMAVREMTEDVLAAHLARGERARIARELHDVVAHHISMIAVQAETARLTTPGLSDAGAQRFAAIGDTARAGLTEMRRLLGVLREDAQAAVGGQEPAEAGAAPVPTADRSPQPGLPQLGQLVDEARDAAGSAARLIVSGPVTRLDPGVELAAYRIVQEALTNARRHAPGAAVDVELHYADGALRLRIRDNGPGPAGPAASSGTGHGLLGMRERAAAAGGSLRTSAGPGGGFCVEAELPAGACEVMTAAGDAP